MGQQANVEETATAEEASQNVDDPVSEEDEAIAFKNVDHNLHAAEEAKREVKEDTTTYTEEVTNKNEDTNSEVHAAGKEANPLSEVQDEAL